LKNDNKIAGWIGTVVFHLLLLLWFMFTGLTQPDPLPEPEGAELMLGWVDAGSGDTAPAEAVEEVAETPPTEAEPTTTEPTPVSEEIVETQTDSEVAVVKPKEESKPKPKEDSKPVENVEPKETKEEREQREKAERIAAMMGKPTGGGKGDGDKPGSKGDPKGKPEGKGVLGGNGTEWSLAGRSFVSRGIVTEEPKEAGIVVLDITVNRDGVVTDMKFIMAKSNTTSTHLIQLAKKAARLHKFNVDPSANVQQHGTLKFDFRLE